MFSKNIFFPILEENRKQNWVNNCCIFLFVEDVFLNKTICYMIYFDIFSYLVLILQKNPTICEKAPATPGVTLSHF